MGIFDRTFPLFPFRQQAARERELAEEQALARLRGRGAPHLGAQGPAGLRGADLARLGEAQGASVSEPARLRMRGGLAQMQREQQLIAEEARRKDRLMAQMQASGANALGEGVKYGTALAHKYLEPALGRAMAGPDEESLRDRLWGTGSLGDYGGIG